MVIEASVELVTEVRSLLRLAGIDEQAATAAFDLLSQQRDRAELAAAVAQVATEHEVALQS